jgi:hypothetical protein
MSKRPLVGVVIAALCATLFLGQGTASAGPWDKLIARVVAKVSSALTMEAPQVERALFSQARWSRRPIQDVAKEWDSYPLRPKPRIVFKDVAKETMCEAAVGLVFSDEPFEWDDTMISAGEKILRMAYKSIPAISMWNDLDGVYQNAQAGKYSDATAKLKVMVIQAAYCG